ncbi:S-layer protein domain-containing protein, partial [Methanomethylovorans sp. PtaU1.Bin093]|uniref:S-layer protein domain-containing protein n=1 Tax=Methanomethylovorans sp. PtaU1.Bin093 TaxID=1811679 RepID=UPI0025EFD182
MREFQKFIVCGALFCLIVLSSTADAVPSNSTGNRIWDENLNLSVEYTWTPQSFSGFYYNVNTGEGSENLTV